MTHILQTLFNEQIQLKLNAIKQERLEYKREEELLNSRKELLKNKIRPLTTSYEEYAFICNSNPSIEELQEYYEALKHANLKICAINNLPIECVNFFKAKIIYL